MKEGASFAATTEQVKKMEAVLAKDQDISFFTAYTGAGAPRFYLALNPELPNPGYAQFIVMTKDLEARERVRSRLMAAVDAEFPAGLGARHAPRAGSPGRLPGAVPRRRSRHAEGARRSPARSSTSWPSSPKVRDVQLDWNDPVRTLKVDLDQDKARALGLTPADVQLVTQTRDERRDAVAAARAREPDRHRRARRARRAPRPRHAEGREPLHAPGHGRAAVPGRARELRARGAGAVAAQPRHGHHRARRREGRRAGRVRDAGDPSRC